MHPTKVRTTILTQIQQKNIRKVFDKKRHKYIRLPAKENRGKVLPQGPKWLRIAGNN